MIPDRSPEQKRHCLTMYAYQTMPMVPKPTNAEQRKVVAKVGKLAAKCQKLPKPVIAKAPKMAASKAKEKKARPTTYAPRRIIDVAALFGRRSLTVNMIQQELGFSVREAAGRKVIEWKAKGLIVEDESPVEYTPGRVQKWWKLA